MNKKNGRNLFWQEIDQDIKLLCRVFLINDPNDSVLTNSGNTSIRFHAHSTVKFQILFSSLIHFPLSETLGIYLIQIFLGTVDRISVPQALWIKVLYYVFLHRYQYPSQASHFQALLECYPFSDPNSIISFFTMWYVMNLKNYFLKTHFSHYSSFDRDFYLLVFWLLLLSFHSGEKLS